MLPRAARTIGRGLFTLLLNCGAAPAEAGWNSSSSPAFNFRENGSALPMYVAFLVCLVVLFVGIARLRRRLGPRDGATAQDERPLERTDRVGRLARLVLLQRRILSGDRSGWIHLPIFWGVVVLGLGSLTIMVDNYVLQPLGLGPSRGQAFKLFQATLELFGVAFVAGVALAIYRRIRTRPERKPADARMLVLLWVLLGAGVSGFALEGLRIQLEGTHEPWAFVGTAVAATIAPLSADTGATLYRILWWSHAVVAFGLMASIPFTALRHVMTAPMNILVSAETPPGGLTTPFNLKELMRAGRFDVKLGADSIDDFAPRERLGFAACADAGYCQNACPAHASGTPLSPRRLVGALREAKGDTLRNGAISEDAIWSCTFCGACAGACPVLVNPMDAIARIRRGLVADNRIGRERTRVLANLARVGNPYGSNPAAREGLGTALGLRDRDEGRTPDLLYWIGCAATFDARTRKVAEATVRILNEAGIHFDVLGPNEVCCGEPARRIGEEGLFQDLASRNIEAIEKSGATKVLTHCAHCFNTFRNEYPELGARFEVVHHSTLLNELIQDGSIQPRHDFPGKVTLHDACYIGRFNGGVEPPRSVLRSISGLSLEEMDRSGAQSFCCGAGGGNYWYEVPRREKIGTLRMREAEATSAGVLVTECPFCLKMLEDAGGTGIDGEPMRVRDLAEVLADSLGEAHKS